MNGMNRHWLNGYRRNFINDIHGVQEQLQAYDKDLYIMWKSEDNTWLIMDDIMNTAIMKIPQQGFETLDSRIVTHIKKIHTVTGFNASWEIQQADERREREEERIQDDMIYNMGKDTHKEVRSLAYGG
jgi:hypothetical protein